MTDPIKQNRSLLTAQLPGLIVGFLVGIIATYGFIRLFGV